MTRNRRLKLSDLEPILNEYRDWLSSWKQVGKDRLVRHNGAFLQGLWFDRLSTGHFRPTLYTKALTIPESKGILTFQHIAIAVHPSNRSDSLNNLKRHSSQYSPDPAKPFTEKRFYSEINSLQLKNPAQIAAAASISAYFSDIQIFKERQVQFFKTITENYQDSQKSWMTSHGNFLLRISELIEENKHRAFLHEIINENSRLEKLS
jgi:hypothetical protein